MTTYTTDELADILILHAMWQRGDDGGARANLVGANLRGAYIRGAYLEGANLVRANLVGANLRGANLAGANIEGAYIRGAYLEGANLVRANLVRADLRGAYLAGANLVRADLRGAYLAGANIEGAYLRGAYLAGANLVESVGVIYADCSWSDHGERGRRLLAVVIDGEPRYYCGCFAGTLDELRQYIADGSETSRESRTLAADFVSARLGEMMARSAGSES